MLHLWSLAVEEQFYILWPFIIWAAWKLKLNLLTIIILITTVSFYISIKFVKAYPTEIFFWPIGRFWELLSGSILAWLNVNKANMLVKSKLWIDKCIVRVIYSRDIVADGSSISNVIASLGLFLLIFGIIIIDEDTHFPSVWTLIPVLGAIFVIVGGPGALFNRLFLMNPVAVWFGLISYPLYLWHWPILSFLQIIETQTPNRDTRIAAVLLSIALAWLTYKFVENPIRFGTLKRVVNPFLILIIFFALGGWGYYVGSKGYLTNAKGYEDIYFKRKGFEHAFGSSLKWYEGKNDWLFLGNEYGQTVAKRRLAVQPSSEYITNIVDQYTAITVAASQTNTRVALLVGPNKSSVYEEYLPQKMRPSDKRYSLLITDQLRKIPNLIVIDPTELLKRNKQDEGALYWRTNTHWNQKGAYLSFASLMDSLSIRYPKVNFFLEGTHRGDLIKISKLNDFPVHTGDNYKYEILPGTQNDMSVWVVGDSFVTAIRPYIGATFKNVSYIGHPRDKVNSLPSELISATEKPDLVLIVRVERAF